MAILVGIFLFVRAEYRKYCREMDEKESKEKAVSLNEGMTRSLLEAFDARFGDGMNGTISGNVRTKVEFSLSTIGTMPLDEQVRESKRLYDMAYETWNRAIGNPDDVISVTAPLNSFCKEIARKKLEIIRKLSEDEP